MRAGKHEVLASDVSPRSKAETGFIKPLSKASMILMLLVLVFIKLDSVEENKSGYFSDCEDKFDSRGAEIKQIRIRDQDDERRRRSAALETTTTTMFLQRRHTASAPPVKSGGKLMKRMSTMFKPASQRVVERVAEMMEEEDEEKFKVSVSSSQSSMDDIRRPSGLGPTIEEHASVMRAYRVQVPPLPPLPPLPPYRPPKPLLEIPPLPVEILTSILSSIPRTSLPALALLSRDFLSAAQAILYGDLDMRDVRNPDTLWIYLVTRRDLTSLTHTLRVPAWPSAQTRAYLIPRVLARMDNLRSLSLPSFDLHILRHHSAFGLRHIEFSNTRLSEQAEAELLMWLDGQTNVVSLRFPLLVDDVDEDASPPTPLPSTPTRIRLLSAPTTPSKPFLFPMPPLSPLPPTPTPTQDTFSHTTETLLPNLTALQGPPRLIILLAPSRPLIDVSITISTPIYDGFRPTTTLESLPPSVRHLRFAFKSVGKRTEEKTLRSAVVVCPAIEELEIEGDAGEACWCSIVPYFKSLCVLIMRKPGTAQVKTAREELDERFPLPKRARTRSTSSTISHSGHSMVVSERARAARLANACPALQRVVFPNGVQWRRPSPSLPPLPRSQSSPCLPFNDLFVKKINRDIVPPPLPRKAVPLTEQRFMKREEVFDLNDSDDDDSLFYKPSLRKDSSSMQGCHEQVEVNVRGAGKMVMALV
ncbi:hypothetical protein EDD18DRAFT_1337998 [Armillaria luteobubalina]|uniref:F-box domain-containing protein n=1 Tax=Armillaria luteobubalina TaxID=153913 RepID=A0AA39TB25_9AGAR|nr:hypothetical protein EDD18DRAFT_1337998 [Armillaria luteobubalina]